MSNIAPIFMAGPRLKLVLDGKVIAHCMGMNLNVRKTARHIHTCGEYGPVGVQTLSFDGVDGSFSIQLLNPFLAQKIEQAASIASQRPDSATAISSATSNSHIAIDDALRADNSPKNATANIKSMFDPSKLLLTNTFILEIWQAYPNGSGGIVDVCQMKVEKVRLSSCSTNISLGSLVGQTFNFQGAYVKILSPSLTGQNDGKVVESDTVIDAQA